MTRGWSDGIRRAENGRWRVRIWLDGRLRKATYSTKAEAEDARDALRARQTAIRLGIPVAPAREAVPTLGGVLDGYLSECTALSRSDAHLRSIRQARALLVRWKGEAGDPPTRRAELVEFVGWCRRKTASKGRTIHNALVILRTALRRADLPVPAAPRLELPRRAPKTLSRQELGRLLERLPLGSVARTAVEIGLRTGARQSEILRLRIGDVDLRRRTLLLRRAKGRPGARGSEEIVPASPGLVRALRAFLAGIPARLGSSEPLLAVGEGESRRALRLTSLRRRLESACRAAGVPVRSTIGWTRAQAATLAREAGMPLGLVSGTLGHVDERTTRTHYDESSREAAERWTARKAAGGVLDRVLRGSIRVRRRPKSTPKIPTKRLRARSSGG